MDEAAVEDGSSGERSIAGIPRVEEGIGFEDERKEEPFCGSVFQ